MAYKCKGGKKVKRKVKKLKDRKSVVQGKSVELGGRSSINKKKRQ